MSLLNPVRKNVDVFSRTQWDLDKAFIGLGMETAAVDALVSIQQFFCAYIFLSQNQRLIVDPEEGAVIAAIAETVAGIKIQSAALQGSFFRVLPPDL